MTTSIPTNDGPANLTLAKTKIMFGLSDVNAALFYNAISKYMAKYECTTILTLGAFFGQISVESANLSQLVENMNYSAAGLLATFPSHFNATTAAQANRNPQLAAQYAYDGRMGNAPFPSLDGWTYIGRGAIGITGKSNYQSVNHDLLIDCVNNPALLQQPDGAIQSAFWFWGKRGLNAYALRGDITSITKRINGGTTALQQRISMTQRAYDVLAGKPVSMIPTQTSPIQQNSIGSANHPSVSEPTPARDGNYPYTYTFQSRSGHVFQIDDDPNAPRILIMHESGSYDEYEADGSRIYKSMQDDHHIIQGDEYFQIQGDETISIGGQLYTKASEIVFNSGSNFDVQANSAQFNIGSFNVDGDMVVTSLQTDTMSVTGGASGGNIADMNVQYAQVAAALDPSIPGGAGAAVAGVQSQMSFGAGSPTSPTLATATSVANGGTGGSGNTPAQTAAGASTTSATGSASSDTQTLQNNYNGDSVAANNKTFFAQPPNLPSYAAGTLPAAASNLNSLAVESILGVASLVMATATGWTPITGGGGGSTGVGTNLPFVNSSGVSSNIPAIVSQISVPFTNAAGVVSNLAWLA